MPTDKDEFFYFTIMDMASCVETWGDEFFEELLRVKPDMYDRLEAFMANKQVQEFLLNQSEVM